MPETTIDNTTTETTIPEEEQFKNVIPEAYREKPYLKDIVSLKTGPEAYEALFKKLDGAQVLIGKKSGLPASDAPVEEWDEVYKKLRPESADAYEFKVAEGQTDDEEFIKAMRGVYHDAGLSTTQGGRVNDGFQKVIEARQVAGKEEAKRLDDEFETLTKATFGDDNKKVMEQVQVALKEHCPDNLKGHIEKLENKHLVVMSGVIHSILKKYVPEDKLKGGGGEGGIPGVTQGDLRLEGQRLMGLPAYKDAFHKDHVSTVARVKEIYSASNFNAKKP